MTTSRASTQTRKVLSGGPGEAFVEEGSVQSQRELAQRSCNLRRDGDSLWRGVPSRKAQVRACSARAPHFNLSSSAKLACWRLKLHSLFHPLQGYLLACPFHLLLMRLRRLPRKKAKVRACMQLLSSALFQLLRAGG